MRHEKRIMEMEIRENAHAEGHAEGRAEGLAEGRAEGMILGTIETMRDDGKTDEEILARITGKYDLTEEEAKEYLNSDIK